MSPRGIWSDTRKNRESGRYLRDITCRDVTLIGAKQPRGLAPLRQRPVLRDLEVALHRVSHTKALERVMLELNGRY